jgi:hypothetical protein
MPAASVDMGAQRLGERVVARHRMLLSAFLVEQHGPSCAPRPQILDLHLQGRGDARERISERRDQRPVSEIAQGYGRN